MVESLNKIVAIEVENISKTFGKQEALTKITFKLQPGEMVALIGPSGSGKSTLLRHFSGLIPADKGSGVIRILDQVAQKDGRINPKIRDIRSEVGFIFQQFNLIGRLTLLTNVMTGMLSRINACRSLMGWFSKKERLQAMQALDRVGLAAYAGQRASTLSGGQQQRAAIARAMEQNAKIILADEPIASLDPQSAKMVMDCLKNLNQMSGVTILISLHQVQFALDYCPRSIAMKAGRIVYDGPSAELTASMLKAIYGTQSNEWNLDGTSALNMGAWGKPNILPVAASAAGLN